MTKHTPQGAGQMAAVYPAGPTAYLFTPPPPRSWRTLLAYPFALLFLAVGSIAANAVNVLEEVTVTAQKRAENIQDVSASITALDSAALERAGIEDITRLELVIPGLRIGRSGGEVRPALRGARTNEVGVAATGIAEQVVGIFQDGIYVPTTTAGLGAYVDLERIEVLRGPQGTLYGRNTFAGSINVISNKPNFDGISGSLKVTRGDYNRGAYQGVLNLPLTDSLATRFVLLSDQHDGYIKNLSVAGTSDDLREKNQFYGRATALWDVNEDLSALLRLEYSQKDSNSEAIWGYQQIFGYQIAETAPGSGVFKPDATVRPGHIYRENYNPAGNPQNRDRGPYEVYRNAVSFDEQDALSITLTLDWAMALADVKLTGNYSKLSGSQFYDNDYSDFGTDFVGGFGRQDDQETWSAELQLTSNSDGPIEWVGGLYFFNQEADWEWLWRANGAIVVPSWGNPGNDPHKVDSLAVYGQAKYAVTDSLRLIGGLRYNTDDKSFTGSIPDWDDSALLYKAAVEFDVLEDSMLYASVATGYRTGGANDARVVGRGANALYDNEEVISYEIGMKNRLLDGAMTFNLALFLNQYDDVKAQLFALACNNDNVALTVNECIRRGVATSFEYYENGGDVDSLGLEADINWLPVENLLLTGTFTWLDSEFDSNYAVGNPSLRPLLGMGNYEGRQDINDPDSQFDFGGWSPALSPEFTFGVSATYDFILGGSVLSPSVNLNYVDDYYAFDTNTPETKVDAHVIADARLTWNIEDKGIEVEAFLLNISDKAVMTRAVVHTQRVNGLPINSVQANWNNPRTWGVSLSYNF